MPRLPMNVKEAGRLGGLARAKALSKKRIREIAIKASKAAQKKRKKRA